MRASDHLETRWQGAKIAKSRYSMYTWTETFWSQQLKRIFWLQKLTLNCFSPLQIMIKQNITLTKLCPNVFLRYVAVIVSGLWQTCCFGDMGNNKKLGLGSVFYRGMVTPCWEAWLSCIFAAKKYPQMVIWGGSKKVPIVLYTYSFTFIF